MFDLFIKLHEQLANLGDRKIAFVLEGRDASGKGGFVKHLLKEDVPFTPDRTKTYIIMTPHALPTRMIVCQLLESLGAKIAYLFLAKKLKIIYFI